MNNKNFFTILLGVLSIWILWPILRWAVGFIVLLIALFVLYVWYKTKQAEKQIGRDNYYESSSGYQNSKNSQDIIDVEYTERRVENDDQ